MKTKIRPDVLLNSVSGALLCILALLTIYIPLSRHGAWFFDVIIALPITAAFCLILSAAALIINVKNKLSWLIAITCFIILAFYARVIYVFNSTRFYIQAFPPGMTRQAF